MISPPLLLLIGVANFCWIEVESANPLASYNIVFQWKQLDYKFPSNQTRNRLLSTKEFIPENNIITGIKVQGQRIFLTVPRWREGIPASLVYLDFDPSKYDGTGESMGPLLNPYPSWEMNQLGNCNALQYVQSMEIDQFGRMWVIDVGRVSIFSPTRTSNDDKCPPKLVLIDLAAGDVIRKFEFPASVVSPTGNFLNDIAVACVSKDECYAYITDALGAKIVVYNYSQNRSWFVHHSSMEVNPDAVDIGILGGDYKFDVKVDGVTLSPKDSNFDRLYFSPLSSLNLFSVSTSILKSSVNGITLEDSDVKNHGKKSSQTDGLAMDSNGLLFYGLLSSNGVAYYNTSSHERVTGKEILLVQNDVDLQWPDTFGFDNGYLYMVTNRLQRYRGNQYDFTETNFRVARVYTGSQSYMFSAKSQKDTTETIPPAVFDATPVTNLDVDDSNKYDTGHDHHQHIDKGQGNNPSTMDTSTNSSMSLSPFTTGMLIFVLVTFVFHPVA